MIDRTDLETLKDLGAGRPAPEEVARLYRRAFAEFAMLALWDQRPLAHPTLAQALSVAQRLRREGTMQSRPLAAAIEAACRAAL